MEKTHIKEKGITIITLVITIIILLILAGISIASLVGNDGLINKAKTAKEKAEKASIIEQIQTDIMAKQAENMSMDLSQNELKEILNKYVEKEEDIKYDETDTSKIASIITKDGKYKILLSDIWDGSIIANKDNNENSYESGSSVEIINLKSEIEALKNDMKTMKIDYDNNIKEIKEEVLKKQNNLEVSEKKIEIVGGYFIPDDGRSLVRKYGNVVTVYFNAASTKNMSKGEIFGKIPEGYRPKRNTHFIGYNAYGTITVNGIVGTNGDLLFSNCDYPANEWFHFDISYICE